MRFKTATLGCKVNQYETQWLRSALTLNGWEDADESAGTVSDADVELVIVNTCSVTSESDAKSRKLISHFAKTCPNAEIVVVGCYAANDAERIRRLTNVSEVIPDKRRLPDFLRRRGLETLPTGVERLSERQRAYVKVQDGCRVGCAYCTIPSTRPYLASRPSSEVASETQVLASNGYREIVLTGIHLGHYGLDLYPPTAAEVAAAAVEGIGPNERRLTLEDYLARQRQVPESERYGLAELLGELVDLKTPNLRFRLGSLEAVEVCDKTIELVARNPDVVCPQFHLSMQSGDDSVLRAMRRRWLSAPYLAKCREIYSRVPDAAITTDVIVGFPGETEEQFERTVEVVREVGFSRVHVFRFSPRPGTLAAEMTNQISPEVKKERAARLIAVAKEEREKFARRFVGRTTRALVENVERRDLMPSLARGTTDRYYEVEIEFVGEEIACGDMVDVRLVALNGDVFTGELIR